MAHRPKFVPCASSPSRSPSPPRPRLPSARSRRAATGVPKTAPSSVISAASPSIATAIDRVYVASTTAVLIWNPQFHQWQGPFDPPDPGILSRVFCVAGRSARQLALARAARRLDPLPARAADCGIRALVPDGLQTIAFDANDPTAGLYLRTARRAGWLLPRGGSRPRPARAPARPVSPARWMTCSGATPRCRPTRRRFWSTRGSAWRSSPRPPARSTTSAGISAPPASGLLFLPDGVALPRAVAVRAPLSGRRGGVRLAGTASGPRRTVPPLAEPAITFVDART